MKEIGGFFELELRRGGEFHWNAIRLNSGHAAFEYILKARDFKRIWLPYFTCRIMAETAERNGIRASFYNIDNSFAPDFDFSVLKSDEGFVYTNYFGLCDNEVKKAMITCPNLIVDNAQAFYSKPLKGVDTFYSPRKYFGLPDGGYLFTDARLNCRLERDSSINRFEHLLGRIETSPAKYLEKFRANDIYLGSQSIKQMSLITRRLLESIDYSHIAEIRRQNFNYLNSHLSATNKLSLNLSSKCVPMVYPYLTGRGDLKDRLLKNKIYVATYWPEVLGCSSSSDQEKELAGKMLALPIDHRYSLKDMKRIVHTLRFE